MYGEGERPAQDLQNAYAGYRVFDEHYEEIGKVDDLFVDENNRPEYIGVKMGFLGMKSTLIPMDIVRANDRRELLEVAASKEVVKNAPSFDDDETISSEHEAEIRRYYGLTSTASEDRDRGAFSGYSPGRRPDVDLEYGERGHSEASSSPSAAPRDREGIPPETTGDDELRVQRREEELIAGTREREVGAVNVRRRVRTDREQIRVPRKREEVTVERVPAEEGEASQRSERGVARVESDEEEIRIPVVEEEVVVEKRPVVKEELRIKKRVVEEEEIVEEGVRKEEVEIEGEADYRDR